MKLKQISVFTAALAALVAPSAFADVGNHPQHRPNVSHSVHQSAEDAVQTRSPAAAPRWSNQSARSAEDVVRQM